MLSFVWIMSIVLSAISLLVMTLLILRRVVLQRRAKEDARMRQRLLQALIAFSEDKDAETLNSVIRSVPPRIAIDGGFEFLGLLRGEEYARIIEIFAESGLPIHIATQLMKGNEAARIHAAEMLAAFSPDTGTAHLFTALDNDRSREVRIAAAISLCDLGAMPPLPGVLRKIGVRGQRSRRLVELFRRVPAERMGELKDLAAKQDGSPFVRAAAIEALSPAQDHELADFFRRSAKDPSSDVSGAAIRALGRLADRDSGDIVTEAMASKDWEVRADAAEAAGRIGTTELIDPLARLLDDDAWTVRYAAAKAMRLIAPQGDEMLREIASSQTSRSQRTASLVLNEGFAS
ncbi:HEAT repeat domain-containing protein [Arvimicrobium flavum]|uniref:HEAT repeat domain-containing protein n=1 Tax=Arvimicrobium flavum TaxID=3393320 RepID=UPI00237AD479|nr:HEAT repeat domain-containing protein [Mesorhizobium shangrilense]